MIRRLLPLVLVLLLLTAPASATIVGTTWNQSNSSTSAFSAYWGAGYAPISTPDFNATEPWASMGRVTIDGNVMVQVRKHYYKTENVTVGGMHWMNFSISDVPVPGYTVDPWHVVNGTEVPWTYIGAYEGSAYNVTTGTYVGDPASVNSQPGGDRLVSVAGQKPLSGLGKASLTMAGFRNMSHSNGVGWELQSFGSISVIQRMYIIEKRNWDSQSVIGTGVTQITDDGATNMAIPTGLTVSLGNATGSVATTHYQTSQATNAVSYRGVENIWGNIWKWVDFINIKANNNPWVANYGAASDVFSGSYSNTGLTLPSAGGYGSDIAYSSGFDYCFLPSAVAGSSSTYITDYYYQATGNKAALLGGRWATGVYAGAMSWIMDSAASSVYRYFGARLAFTPPVVANFTYTNTSAAFIFDDESFTISTLTGLSGTPSSYNWSFGDGSLSTEQNPTHTYPAAGTYSVNLTASDGTNYATTIESVESSNPIILSQFTPVGIVIWYPHGVNFADDSTGPVTAWNWSFGDGNHSALQNPTYYWPAPGVYTVSLNASNIAVYSINSTTVIVDSTNFAATPLTGVRPLTVSFYDTVNNNATSWLWAFGDGATSALQSPSHKYSNPGSYTVNLTVYSADDSLTTSRAGYINVTGPPGVSCDNANSVTSAALVILSLIALVVVAVIVVVAIRSSGNGVGSIFELMGVFLTVIVLLVIVTYTLSAVMATTVC